MYDFNIIFNSQSLWVWDNTPAIKSHVLLLCVIKGKHASLLALKCKLEFEDLHLVLCFVFAYLSIKWGRSLCLS